MPRYRLIMYESKDEIAPYLPFHHVGLIYKEDGIPEYFRFDWDQKEEEAQPVPLTKDFDEWTKTETRMVIIVGDFVCTEKLWDCILTVEASKYHLDKFNCRDHTMAVLNNIERARRSIKFECDNLSSARQSLQGIMKKDTNVGAFSIFGIGLLLVGAIVGGVAAARHADVRERSSPPPEDERTFTLKEEEDDLYVHQNLETQLLEIKKAEQGTIHPVLFTAQLQQRNPRLKIGEGRRNLSVNGQGQLLVLEESRVYNDFHLVRQNGRARIKHQQSGMYVSKRFRTLVLGTREEALTFLIEDL